MNVEALNLRDLASWERSIEARTSWLSSAGVPHAIRTVPEVPCLRFDTGDRVTGAMVLIPANAWAATCCASLVGAPWTAMAEPIVRGFVATHGLALSDHPLPTGALIFKGVCLPPSGCQMPCMDADGLPMYVESVRGLVKSQVDFFVRPSATLELRLAPVHLGRVDAQGLKRGDLLLFGNVASGGTGWIGDNPVFKFIFEENKVQIDSMLETEAAAHEMSAARGSQLGSLSITLDAVIGTLPMTLEQLSNLSRGDVLELPADAHNGVRIRDAGRVVAIGELVRVNDRLGVVLHTLAGAS